MNSRTTASFRAAFARLPRSVREQARAAYRLFLANPYHPSLHFKQVHPTRPIYSARVNRRYRVLGVSSGVAIEWFWIGTHAEYDRLLRS